MFGYIRPCNPELKMREFEQYKAVYCGLCHALGRRYGPLSRFILNYDLTFYALLRLSQAEGCAGMVKKRCPYRPFRKRPCACVSSELDEAADASVLLFYHKLRDTLADAHGFKKAGAALLLPFAALLHRKAAKRAPQLARIAADYMSAQQAAEQKRTPVLDEAAEPTGELLSQLLRRAAAEEPVRRVLSRLGYFLGRWVYLVDAVDDLPEDLETGGYNPFAAAFSLAPGAELSSVRQHAELLLNACAYEIAAALALLPKGRFSGVLDNTLTLGLKQMQDRVLAGKTKQKDSPGRRL